MGKYRDHREPRRRRNSDDPHSFPEQASEPRYFHQSAAESADPLDAEVLWFNDSKGFGFVRLGDGSEAYLHARALEAAGRRDVSEGMRLKVTVEESPRGRQVSHVLEIDEESPNVSPLSKPTDRAAATSDGPDEIEGTVKWYNHEKGFGFIAPSSGEKDVFVHATALSRSGLTTLAEGQKVLMECGQGKKGTEVRTIRLA